MGTHLRPYFFHVGLNLPSFNFLHFLFGKLSFHIHHLSDFLTELVFVREGLIFFTVVLSLYFQHFLQEDELAGLIRDKSHSQGNC